jgi:hypothetical protein
MMGIYDFGVGVFKMAHRLRNGAFLPLDKTDHAIHWDLLAIARPERCLSSATSIDR